MSPELQEAITGLTAAVATIGWRTDWRDKSGCGETREEAVAVIQANVVLGVADSDGEEWGELSNA